jgi:hypothetical protein
MSDLPRFQKRSKQTAQDYAARVFNHGDRPEDTTLKELIAFEDGHFRAIFRRDYFTLPEGQTEPSKSQWNTLKKRMRRMNRRVFVFKEYGTSEEDFYIDFGFFTN